MATSNIQKFMNVKPLFEKGLGFDCDISLAPQMVDSLRSAQSFPQKFSRGK